MSEREKFMEEHKEEFKNFDAYSYLVLAACLADAESREIDEQEEMLDQLEETYKKLKDILVEALDLELPEEGPEITVIERRQEPSD